MKHKRMTIWFIWIGAVGLLLSLIGTTGYLIYSGKDNELSQKDLKDKIESSNLESKEEILNAIAKLSLSAKIDTTENNEILDGVSVWMLIKIKDLKFPRRKYLIDGGLENKNRFSIYLDNDNNLCFRIIDLNSETQTIKLANDKYKFLENFIVANFELGISNEHSFLRISINGKTLSKSIYDYMISFDNSNINKMKLGGDIYGKNTAVFYLNSIIVYNKTQDTPEKEKLLNFLLEKPKDTTMFFYGNTVMETGKFK